MPRKFDELIRFAASKRVFSAYVFGMLLSSTIPMSDAPDTPLFWSKINPSLQNLLHIPMFFGFTLLFCNVIGENRLKNRHRIAIVLIVSILMGIALEGIQILVPGRYPGFEDMLLNLIGAVLGICFIMILYSRITRAKHCSPAPPPG